MTAVDAPPLWRPGSRARESHVPQPRRVAFDWADVPRHWVPGDPHTTHVINTLHMLFPAGERWFVKVFKQALPLITDPELHEQVRAFMSQEGIHATAHDTARAHLEAQGIDTSRYVAQLDFLFERLLGDRRLPGPLQRRWLETRLAAVAAIEHYTAILGQWILEQDGLEEAGADPVMLDLLRWHGAEEVEHRSVAFDCYQHVCANYPLRFAVSYVVFPMLTALVWSGTRALLDEDIEVHDRKVWRGYLAGQRTGRLPSMWQLFAAGPRYLRPDYHPSQEGDLDLAYAYIARSPSHLRAAETRARIRSV